MFVKRQYLVPKRASVSAGDRRQPTRLAFRAGLAVLVGLLVYAARAWIPTPEHVAAGTAPGRAPPPLLPGVDGDSGVSHLPSEAAHMSSSEVVYPFGSLHSPLYETVVRHLAKLARDHPGLEDDAFIKVGDSITASPKYLSCFQRAHVWVAPRLQDTLVALRSSRRFVFGRASQSAQDGWSAWQPLAGNPSPLSREVLGVNGRFALVMFGTNDIETSRVTSFARRLIRLIDHLLARGVVPLLSTIPERRDSPGSRLEVPRFNAVIRVVAEARRVPLMDYHLALSALPHEGLTRDGIHPNVYVDEEGVPRPCDFSEAGLTHGFNQRNLISLQAIDRVRKALSGRVEPAPITSRYGPAGLVDRLPMLGVDTMVRGAARRQSCEGGSERFGSRSAEASLTYEFELAEGQTVEILGLAADDGRSLSFAVTERPGLGCRTAGRGFGRVRLPKGEYSLTVEGADERVMLALLPERVPAP